MNEMSAIKITTEVPVLDRIRALLPEIEARADEIERGARVPLDLLQKLETAGAFRICVPAIFGGEEVSQQMASQIIEEVAQADASVAWHLMVAAGSQVITSRLPLASLREYYANGPDVWPKAAAAPKALAIPVDGGYRISGRWPLASGAREFEWISLGFFIKEGDGIRRAPNGMPDFRFCLVPRGDVKVYETWDAVGLRGTRSDDLEVKDLFVPEDWQGSLFGKSSVNAAGFGISMPAATVPHHSAVAKGILKGAIADLARDALTRKPAFNPTMLMKDDGAFRTRFGELAVRVDALCALAEKCVDTLQRCGEEGRDVTPMEASRITASETLIHQEAASLMDKLLGLSGAAGVYMTNRMQRRWRDMRCAAQHQAANIGNYGNYAVALTNQAAAIPAASVTPSP